MDSTIAAQEIKRRGISAVDEALREGPVHVILRNRPRYVILSEQQYRGLVGRPESVSRLWDRLLGGYPEGSRPAYDILRQIHEERGAWRE